MYSDEEFEDFSSYDSGHESNEEEMEEEDIEIDFGAKEEDFQVLSADQIVKNMKTSIQEIKAVIPLSSTMLRILLNHFKWDQSILMEKYFSDEKDAMFAQVKLAPPTDDDDEQNAHETIEVDNEACVSLDCEICYLTMSSVNMMTGLKCRHFFCNDCWNDYLSTKISNEGACQMIQCPSGQDCKELIDDQTVIKLIKDPKIKVKFQQLITDSFVQCNKKMKWCPAPDCPNAIRVSSTYGAHSKAGFPVKCQCGFEFCFGCKIDKVHLPITCSMMKNWMKKCADDSETLNWISSNTKDCPKCSNPIEKNGGCNHMICYHGQCKYNFCWMCLGDWKKHQGSGYDCNAYKDPKNIDDINKAKTNLQKYMFYHDRYMNHLKSLELENKLYEKVQETMEKLQTEEKMSWVEVQFLKDAVNTLGECRQTLMHSYVFAFYLEQSVEKEIFEANQKDLENATETLSGYLERDMDDGEKNADDSEDDKVRPNDKKRPNVQDEDIRIMDDQDTNMDDKVNDDAPKKFDAKEIKQKVQDKMRYLSHRRKILVNHVEEGRDKDLWE